jgi:flagellar basal body rod protein FlgB
MFASPGELALERRLAALVAGQSVLAQEVANVSTPGYTGQGTAAFQASMQAALSRQLGAPSPGTIVAPVPPAGGGAFVPLAAPGTGRGAVTPDGNGVDFNALMVDVAENDLGYQAVAHQLQLQFLNIGLAIDNPAGSGA